MLEIRHFETNSVSPQKNGRVVFSGKAEKLNLKFSFSFLFRLEWHIIKTSFIFQLNRLWEVGDCLSNELESFRELAPNLLFSVPWKTVREFK